MLVALGGGDAFRHLNVEHLFCICHIVFVLFRSIHRVPAGCSKGHPSHRRKAGGVLGSPLPLFRGRRASPRACYNWQGSRPGPKANRPGLYIRFAVSGLIRRFLCPRGERHERLGKRIENLLVVIVEIVFLRFGIENILGEQSRNFNDARPVSVEAGTEVFQNSEPLSNLRLRSARCMAAWAIHSKAVVQILRPVRHHSRPN